MINDLVQREPADALDPEIMGSLAAIGIAKGRPFNPDARMRKILTEADACTTPGAVGALLRREGLYSSHLVCGVGPGGAANWPP